MPMTPHRRLERLEAFALAAERREMQQWADRTGAERGMSGAYVLQEFTRYLSDPTDHRMDAFEAALTDAERQELVGIKDHWRKILGIPRR
jgi:hypothetical protein